MHGLIIGLSSVAQRRVIPALCDLASVTRIDVASRSKPAPAEWAARGEFFSSYDDALARSAADFVYISLPNADHFLWITRALASGRHVIVDKPATPTLAETRHCLAQAAKASRLLAEATVFSHNPQIAAMRDFFQAQGPLTHIDAKFIIPPLPAANFRNHTRSGGGCLLDMGPYAAAVARLFARAPLRELHTVRPALSSGLDIDIGFSLLARFEDGLRYSGHFSFESEYLNRLTLVGARGSIVAERVFSPPPDQACVWQTRRDNMAGEETHPACDVFRIFLEKTITAMASGAFGSFAEDMLLDAQFREAIFASLPGNERQ